MIFGDNILYTASKNAGSTVRKWVSHIICEALSEGHGQAEGAANAGPTILAPSIISSVQKELDAPAYRIFRAADEIGLQYHAGFRGDFPNHKTYCIKRDPVERFISCVSQKFGTRGFRELKSASHLLDNFQQLVLTPLAPYRNEFSFNENFRTWKDLILPRHFAPQAYSFGERPEFFTRVFEMSEVSFGVRELLETHFDRPLPRLHLNKQQRKFPTNDALEAKIREVYALDYNCGWA